MFERVRFWPNPAVELSIAARRAGKSQTVTKARNRPEADIRLLARGFFQRIDFRLELHDIFVELHLCCRRL